MPLIPEEVGKSYDELNGLFKLAFGQHIHNGYWSSVDDDTPFDVALERMNSLVIEKLGAGRNWSVLDVGCGMGELARRLADTAGCEAVGISNSQVQVDEATALALNNGGRARFEFADAHALPFPDANFDGALAIESLSQVGDAPQVLQEIARVLRPGGRLVVADFAEHVPLSLKQKEYLAAEHFDFMRYSEVESVFGRAGFHALECMDLSWTTVMSQEAMLQSVRSRRSELLAQYSADFVDAFEANWLKLCDIFEHHLAYFLLIAEKARL